MLQPSREKNGIYVERLRFEQMENTIISQNNQASLLSLTKSKILILIATYDTM